MVLSIVCGASTWLSVFDATAADASNFGIQLGIARKVVWTGNLVQFNRDAFQVRVLESQESVPMVLRHGDMCRACIWLLLLDHPRWDWLDGAG